MNLFELMATLVLDDGDFISALHTAENAATSFNGDAEGVITAHDDYTDTAEELEGTAEDFEGDATGEIKAEDEYTDVAEDAEQTADEFDGDAEGEISADDQYTGVIDDAESDADNFDGDAEGEISAIDSYTGVVATAESDADSFDGDATGTITADTSEFKPALEQAESDADTFGAAMGDIASGIKQALVGAGIVGVIQQISQAFAQAVTMSADYADSVDKGSQSLNLSKQAFQEWRYVAGQSGADVMQFRRGISNLNELLVNNGKSMADISDDMKFAMDSLKIRPRDYHDMDSFLHDVIYGLSNISDQTARMNIAEIIFGKQASTMAALFNTSEQWLDELIAQAHEFGLIMSDEDVTAGVAYGDAVSLLNQSVDALKQNIVSGLFPLLTDAANMMSKIVSFFNGRTQEKGIEQWFSDIDDSMKQAFTTAEGSEAEVGSLISTLKSMSDNTGTAKGNLEQWEAVAKRLIKLCPQLKGQIDLVNKSFSEQNGTLEENAAAYFQTVRAQAVANAVQDKLNALATAAGEIRVKETEALMKQNEAMGKREIAMRRYRELIEKAGLSDTVGYREQDLENLSNFRLAQAMIELVADRFTKPNFWGMPEVTDDGAKQAQDAARELHKTQGEYESINSEIDSMKESLQTATEEYNNFTAAATEYINSVQAGLDGLKDKTIQIDFQVNWPRISFDSLFGGESRASGLNYVPYDGYVANLHRGETILNQAQARQWRNGDGGSVGGINSQELASAVANAVRVAMAGVSINMNGERVGDVVTERVSSNLATQVRARRYGI
jgi:hypothetical protein